MAEADTQYPDGPEAMHQWFGLSYANYLAVPRVLIQAMSDEWQSRARGAARGSPRTSARGASSGRRTPGPTRWGSAAMSSSEVFETPAVAAIAQHLSPAGHLREYTYGEFEDDDLWDDDGPESCSSCGGNDERGYDDCEYASVDCYVPGPDVLDDEGHLIHHGCPRVVGAF